ncbi:MAG: DUF6055 domain-containing protein [Umezawaea sp.]
MLVQYIKDRDGLAMVNRLWNEARDNEHPLEVYRRITGITQAKLNRRVGEYATRNVTWDFGNRSTLMPFIDNVYGSSFLKAYNGGLVEAVDSGAGHYRMDPRTAPSDYGFNKVKLVAATDGALVKVRVKGHAETGATGWTFGLVAARNGTPRYSQLMVGVDGQITFQLQSGEREVWLVVTATPSAVSTRRRRCGSGSRNRRAPPRCTRRSASTPTANSAASSGTRRRGRSSATSHSAPSPRSPTSASTTRSSPPCSRPSPDRRTPFVTTPWTVQLR